MSSRKKKDARKCTPYSCSTRRQHRGTSPDFMPDYVPTTDKMKLITDILLKTWIIHWLSPLWKLDFDSLASYSQLLSLFISSHQNNDLAITAKFSVLERFGRDGSPGLEINLTNNKGTRAFTAILCTISHPTRVKRGFTSLPLLLLHGDTSLSRMVSDWLQSTFDCHISPYSLEQEDLSLLLAQYATSEKVGRGVSGVELVYETPTSVRTAGLSTVSMELSLDSALSLWDSVNKSEEAVGRKTSGQREAFLRALAKYLEQYFHFNMETLTLSRITTPALHADKSGRIKFLDSSRVIPILSVLQERKSVH